MTEQNILKHVAVIPDGNRRWAREKGLHPWVGHIKGAKALEEILKTVLDLQIYCFTFWAASYDNLTKRSKLETKYLYEVFTKEFLRLLKRKELYEHQIKVNFFGGFREIAPKKLLEATKKLEEATRTHNKMFLNFLIAYNGTDEMIRAIKNIVASGIKPEKINDALIKQNLWTKDLPPVDLIVRTGEEKDPHNSTGFMMWDTAYSQYYFTKTLWPDFGSEEFIRAIKGFSKNERRMGG